MLSNIKQTQVVSCVFYSFAYLLKENVLKIITGIKIILTKIKYNQNLLTSIFVQCFFDTPGLTLTSFGKPYKDLKVRVESAWSSIQLYDVVIVIFDVHRHLTR